MKRVFLLLAALCFSSLLLAQDRILDAIENRFGIHFIYDSSLSHKLEKLKPKPAATLEASLKQTFTGTGIDWQVRGSNVILKPSRKPVRYGGTVTLSGYVTDSSSSEILIGAGVLAEGGRGLSTGAVTNEYGFYTITLPAGTTSQILFEPVTFPSNVDGGLGFVCVESASSISLDFSREIPSMATAQ